MESLSAVREAVSFPLLFLFLRLMPYLLEKKKKKAGTVRQAKR